jgi:hypothetical protein
MRCVRTPPRAACAAALLLAALAACGDDTHIPQAASSTPFAATSVAIVQQGDAPVSIDTSSVTFALDGTRSLVAHLSVHSDAAAAVTLVIRGSIYDPTHALVGDLTGGQINVAPGSTVPLELTGPPPLGTIASAVFEATAQPAPA